MLLIKLKQTLHPMSQLFINGFWLLSAEMISKISRVVTIVVLATALTPISYGTAILALACHDMMAILLRAGTGSQIIRCDESDLPSYAKNGATIQWVICLLLASSQFFIADSIAAWYGNQDLSILLKVMAVTYLFYPLVCIKVFLLQRANHMRRFSFYNGICITVENLSTAAFALLGADFMAVAYSKVIFSIMWFILFSIGTSKSYGLGFELHTLKKLLCTSGQLFSSEFLKSLRLHADTFIAGKIMPPEIFGLYSFAKNASFGLSQSVANVLNSALFPFMCKLQRNDSLTQQQKLIYIIAVSVGMLFVVQALLAPFYVPLIFDDKWHSMIPVVTIMCLVALPSLIVDTYCNFERVKGHFNREIFARFICLSISVFLLYVCELEQPMDFALVIFISSLLWCAAIYPKYSFLQKLVSNILFYNRRKTHEY